MKKESKSEIVVPLRIVLVDPPVGVDFGVQEGNATITKPFRSNDQKMLTFNLSVASPSKETDPMILLTFLEPSCKDRQWDDLSTSTLENPLDR